MRNIKRTPLLPTNISRPDTAGELVLVLEVRPNYSVHLRWEKLNAFAGSLAAAGCLVSDHLQVKVERQKAFKGQWAEYNRFYGRVLAALSNWEVAVDGNELVVAFSGDNWLKDNRVWMWDRASRDRVHASGLSAQELCLGGGLLGNCREFMLPESCVFAGTYEEAAAVILEAAPKMQVGQVSRALKEARELGPMKLAEGLSVNRRRSGYQVEHCAQFRALTNQGIVKGMFYPDVILQEAMRLAKVDFVFNTEALKLQKLGKLVTKTVIGIKAYRTRRDWSWSPIGHNAAMTLLTAPGITQEERVKLISWEIENRPIIWSSILRDVNSDDPRAQMAAVRSVIEVHGVFDPSLYRSLAFGTTRHPAVLDKLNHNLLKWAGEEVVSAGIYGRSFRGIAHPDLGWQQTADHGDVPVVSLPDVPEGLCLLLRHPNTGFESWVIVWNEWLRLPDGTVVDIPLMSQAAGSDCKGDFDGDFYSVVCNPVAVELVARGRKHYRFQPIDKQESLIHKIKGDSKKHDPVSEFATVLESYLAGVPGPSITIGGATHLLCMLQRELFFAQIDGEDTAAIEDDIVFMVSVLEACLKALKHELNIDRDQEVRSTMENRLESIQGEFPFESLPDYLMKRGRDVFECQVSKRPDFIEVCMARLIERYETTGNQPWPLYHRHFDPLQDCYDFRSNNPQSTAKRLRTIKGAMSSFAKEAKGADKATTDFLWEEAVNQAREPFEGLDEVDEVALMAQVISWQHYCRPEWRSNKTAKVQFHLNEELALHVICEMMGSNTREVMTLFLDWQRRQLAEDSAD